MHGTVQVRLPERQIAAIPHAYLMLIVLSLVNMFNFMDRILFSVLLEPIKQDLALTDTQMGLLGGIAFGILYGVASLFMGRLADTRNRVTVLSSALAIWSAASALCGQAMSFAQMFAARGAVGVGVSGCPPTAHSLIGDYFPPERRSLALAIFTAIGTSGTIVGLVMGGLALEAFGWRGAFVAFGSAGVLFAPIAWLLLREPQRGTFEHTGEVALGWGESLRLLLSRPTVRSLLIAMPLVMSFGGIATWVPAFLQRSLNISAADVGAYGGLSLGLGLVLGTLGGGLIVNALRKHDPMWEFRWPAVATAVAIILLIPFAFVQTAAVSYTLLFLAFFAAGTSFGPALACMLVVAEPRLRGSMVALNVLATALISYGVTPAFIGFVSDFLIRLGFGEANGESLRYALLGSLVLPALAIVFFLRASRTARKDTVL